MRKKAELSSSERYLAATHEVLNQPSELCDYNLYATDAALREAVVREGAAWAEADLHAFGGHVGSRDYIELGRLANRHLPELDTHDRFGHRVDLVHYHPAYHALMKTAIEQGLHSSPWSDPRPGAHVARAARYFMHAQVEAGHGCPITMTFAVLPSLRLQPDVCAQWEPKITGRIYDPRNVPADAKQGVTLGMAMTEKQGGSDVRANTTRAVPLEAGGPGRAYELVGHKYFVSAPMCDAFLALAHAPGGLSCFLVPRWRPDGTRNPLQIQRLKQKMGNRSNASCETELRGALGWMVGPEGRGVATIIQMVAMTRFDCMIGSSAGMRMAVSQAIHHCRERKAFGRPLAGQPLMQNVLADLAVEGEAATVLTMRLARALDRGPDENLLARIMTPVGKYWICKRTPHHAYEAMECIGGSGVMEDSPMSRLFRDAPVNAIWEGSGNIQCLDLLRALQKSPDAVEAYVSELESARGAHQALDGHVASLKDDLRKLHGEEHRARELAERMAAALQGSLLVRHAPGFVADAYCRSRLVGGGYQPYGSLPHGVDCMRIIERALPAGV